MASDIIDSEQCAALLRCTSERVEELARAGEIPGLKIGRNWLFVQDDLVTYLAEKARAEAEQRRAKRRPNTLLPLTKPRRQVPPVLPTPPFEASRPNAGERQKIQESSRRVLAAVEGPLDHGRLYVSVAEAARMLSMGKSTFWREVKADNLPKPVKIGGLTRWRVADLERYVRGLRS